MPSALNEAQRGRQEAKETDAVLSWKLRLLEVEVLLWQGKPRDCLALLESPPPAVSASPELAIRTKLAQGRALYGLGEPAAESRLAEAEQLASSHHPSLLGEIALAQGGMYYAKGEFEAARQKFADSLDLAHKYGQQLLESKALGSIGRLFTRVGRFDEAIDYSLKALELSQRLKARHIEAIIRLNLGWNYWELGDLEQASPFFDDCEKLASAAGMKQTQDSCLNNLGRIALNLGDNLRASDYFSRALALAKGLGNDSEASVYLDNLALASLNLGHFDEAQRYNQDALVIRRKQQDRIEELRLSLSSAWIAVAKKDFGAAREKVQAIIRTKDMPKSLRWEAEDILAGIYLASGQTALARTQFRSMLDTLDSARSSIHDDQHRLAFSSREAAFYTDYIRFLVAQHDPIGAMQLAESMRARTLEEALGKTATRHPALPVIQNFLRTNRKIILAYWLAPEHSYLWVVTPTQAQAFILPSKQEIETRVEQYQHSVITLGDVERTNATGQELYQILIAPAQKMIPPGAQVVVIPDGSLGKLNFETLIAPQPSPHFWIDDAQIEAADSMALLVSSRSSRQRPRTLLAIGDPVEVTSDYPRLKYASQEIKAATEHFVASKPKIFSEAAATPSSYTQNAPGQYDLIHFATHGFASETRPLESAIILSPEKDKSFKLYGRDIVKIPLKADIVTISACYGAGKRTYSGEGLVGLAWAFLRAGAHQVIAGLWDVEDQPTPELMQNFYSELATGKSAALALHDAKLKMLHSTGVYRLPYYWAALQLYVGS